MQILQKYLINKFLKNFLFSSICLSVVYNLIELFEKLARIKIEKLSYLLKFISLNIPITAINFLSLSSYIAVCLLIFEFYKNNYWHNIFLLGIRPKKILNIFIGLSLIIALISFILKEFLIIPVHKKAEWIRLEKLKGTDTKKILNKWVALDSNSYAYLESFCLEKYTGSGLNILFLDNQNNIEKKLFLKNFYIEKPNFIIKSKNAEEISFITFKTKYISDFSIQIPVLIKKLINNKDSTFGKFCEMDKSKESKLILATLLTQLLSHLEPIIYILLPFLIFFLCIQKNSFVGMFSIAVIYPISIIATNFSLFIAQQKLWATIVLIPYLILFALLAIFFVLIRTN